MEAMENRVGGSSNLTVRIAVPIAIQVRPEQSVVAGRTRATALLERPA